MGDLHAKKAMVDSARFNLQRLEEMQRFQKVYAPFDGVITARNIDIGALINAGANAPGKELFDIAATGSLRVYVNVPQQYSRDVHTGRRGGTHTGGISGAAVCGKDCAQLGRHRPGIAHAAHGSGCRQSQAGELLPGAFLSVHLKLRSKVTTVVIPVNTLIFRSEGLQVAVVRNDKAELTTVTMGRDYGTEVEVLSGLAPGDEVIENPSDSLVSGAEVRIASKGRRGEEMRRGSAFVGACYPAAGGMHGGSEL